MKKIIIVAAMVLGLSFAAAAQPRAVGLRGGIGLGAVSYQHSLGNDFVEAGVGLYGTGFSVEGIYNFMLMEPNWTSRGTWGVYAGPGANVGIGETFTVAVAGQVGLEYTFWFPLQLSVDVRPHLNLIGGGGLDGFYPTLGVRYRF